MAGSVNSEALPMMDCNYPDCGCDWDEICAAEVERRQYQRRQPSERYPWLGRIAVGGIVLCLAALAAVWIAFLLVMPPISAG